MCAVFLMRAQAYFPLEPIQDGTHYCNSQAVRPSALWQVPVMPPVSRFKAAAAVADEEEESWQRLDGW